MMKRWFLGAVLIILLIAFSFLKQGVHKSSMTDDQEQAAQAAQQAQQNSKAKAAATKQAAIPAAEAAATAPIPAEEIVGDPATAKHHVEVGWIYTAADVVNSDKLQAALAEVRTFAQRSGGTVSAVLVDVDVPTEDRSPAAKGVMDLGVDVDGNSVYANNPSEAPPGALTTTLNGAIKP